MPLYFCAVQRISNPFVIPDPGPRLIKFRRPAFRPLNHQGDFVPQRRRDAEKTEHIKPLSSLRLSASAGDSFRGPRFHEKERLLHTLEKPKSPPGIVCFPPLTGTVRATFPPPSPAPTTVGRSVPLSRSPSETRPRKPLTRTVRATWFPLNHQGECLPQRRRGAEKTEHIKALSSLRLRASAGDSFRGPRFHEKERLLHTLEKPKSPPGIVCFPPLTGTVRATFPPPSPAPTTVGRSVPLSRSPSETRPRKPLTRTVRAPLFPLNHQGECLPQRRRDAEKTDQLRPLPSLRLSASAGDLFDAYLTHPGAGKGGQGEG